MGRTGGSVVGPDHQTVQVSDYADDLDVKVGLYKRSGLAGGLREGPRLYLKEPYVERARASTQLSSYAATADGTASQKQGSILGSTDAGNRDTKPPMRKP